ncbi:hypothetical protein DFH27DRAFT_381954 [Peziza echinospora]|nr:hypothetical protein DFH27DRAFT_381954 [Peziza echinospora]
MDELPRFFPLSMFLSTLPGTIVGGEEPSARSQRVRRDITNVNRLFPESYPHEIFFDVTLDELQAMNPSLGAVSEIQLHNHEGPNCHEPDEITTADRTAIPVVDNIHQSERQQEEKGPHAHAPSHGNIAAGVEEYKAFVNSDTAEEISLDPPEHLDENRPPTTSPHQHCPLEFTVLAPGPVQNTTNQDNVSLQADTMPVILNLAAEKSPSSSLHGSGFLGREFKIDNWPQIVAGHEPKIPFCAGTQVASAPLRISPSALQAPPCPEPPPCPEEFGSHAGCNDFQCSSTPPLYCSKKTTPTTAPFRHFNFDHDDLFGGSDISTSALRSDTLRTSPDSHFHDFEHGDHYQPPEDSANFTQHTQGASIELVVSDQERSGLPQSRASSQQKPKLPRKLPRKLARLISRRFKCLQNRVFQVFSRSATRTHSNSEPDGRIDATAEQLPHPTM